MKLARKIISYSFSAFAVLILSGFFSLRQVTEPVAFAHHVPAGESPIHACRDITGTTNQVPTENLAGRESGISESGQLDFNSPDLSYQACVEKSSETFTVAGIPTSDANGQFVKGWVWNTNLGYISMFCNSGTNFGASCGGVNPVNYGTFANPATGRLMGFAWGDNIGWVSMGCENGQNSGVDCGNGNTSVNYGVYVVTADGGANVDISCAKTGSSTATLARGDLYGCAWTDSVGWINLLGAHVELGGGFDGNAGYGTTNDPLPDLITNPGGSALENPGAAVIANGDAYHDILIKILRDGVLEEPGVNFNFEINADWTDTVRTDQISTPGPIPAYNAVKKPGVALQATVDISCTNNPIEGKFCWVDGLGIVGRITSIAPTAPDDNSRPAPPNSALDKLTLNSLSVDVKNPADGAIIQTISIVSMQQEFKFKEAVKVTDISGGESGGEITAIRDGLSPVYIMVAEEARGDLPERSEIQISAQAHNCDSAGPYELKFDDESGDAGATTVGADGNIKNETTVTTISGAHIYTLNGFVCTTGNAFGLNDVTTMTLSQFLGTDNALHPGTISFSSQVKEGATVSSTGVKNDALGFVTVVSYVAEGQNVRYFSAIKKSGSILNQSAGVQGNVRIVATSAGDEDIEALGNNPQDMQIKRQNFLEEITDRINPNAASEIAASIDGSYTVPSTGALFEPTGNKDKTAFLKRNASSNTPCDIVIGTDPTDPETEPTADFGIPEDLTIVSEGCDVFINQNIFGGTKRLGIIALEDLTMTGAHKGGNIYICNRVTDVAANIVADGSVFPYGASETNCGDRNLADTTAPNYVINQTTGLPVLNNPREIAKRQLTIMGSILSNNTFGGSFDSPPVLGDGTQATSAELDKVRLYDFNFFRYAHTKPNDDQRFPDCWADDVTLSKKFPESDINTCPDNNTRDQSIINIIYREPKGLPIFDALLK